jgi:hypothetical protein
MVVFPFGSLYDKLTARKVQGGENGEAIMFGEGSLTFREFVMRETVSLASIHEAVFDFLRGRDDAAVFGAQAVNAYVDQPRMTQDVDILCVGAAELAEQLCSHLHERFHIAVRAREAAGGAGYRIYQVRQPKNRHLVHLRGVDRIPDCNRLEEVLVLTPPELISRKVLSMVSRLNTAKGMTDAADLRRLLLTFPELKREQGPVFDLLRGAGSETALSAWRDLVSQEFVSEDEDDDF